MPAPAGSNTKWADGLRGLASLLVVTAHISRSFAPHLLDPTMGENLAPVLLQLPVIRCFVMGRASVAAFAVLSGYVNALKPTRQTRAGDINGALVGVAKSAYRRTGRFMIPALVATSLSWLVCQLGGYELAKTVDSSWIRDTSPSMSMGFIEAIRDLFQALVATWTTGSNQYDRIQWTLCYLLRGSMLVYLTLFATAYVRPKWRILVYFVLEMYYWKIGDAVIGINIYAGLIMAELTYEPEVWQYAESKPLTVSIVSASMIFLGIIAISYPEEHSEWAVWSNAMTSFGRYIFPERAEFGRFYPGLGAQLICYGVMFNKTAKRFLSSTWPCYLGRVSFAIYLLHAPLMRTLLTYFLYGLSRRPASPGKDKFGHEMGQPWTPILSTFAAFILIPIWYVLLYRIAALWVQHVDPFCGRVTDWIENKLVREEHMAEKQHSLGHA